MRGREPKLCFYHPWNALLGHCADWTAALIEDCLEYGKRYGHSEEEDEQKRSASPLLSSNPEDDAGADGTSPRRPLRPASRDAPAVAPLVRRDTKPQVPELFDAT